MKTIILLLLFVACGKDPAKKIPLGSISTDKDNQISSIYCRDDETCLGECRELKIECEGLCSARNRGNALETRNCMEFSCENNFNTCGNEVIQTIIK